MHSQSINEPLSVQALRLRLVKLIPGHPPDAIIPTPIPGLYQVRYGLKVFYLTGDGRYLLEGDLIDLKGGQNLTRDSVDRVRKKLIASLPTRRYIEYRPHKAPRYTITVFSDVDCPYCRALHEEVPQLNHMGIAVRYLFFPRTGPDTPSYYTAVSAWCARNRQQAFTRAMEGYLIPSATCPNPVKQDFDLGVSLGVNGTPTVILPDGEMLPGYRSATDLAKILDDQASAS